MKYVVLVSHGTFAPGLHSVLNMLAGGGREDVLSTSLQDGMGADEFAENFGKLIEPVKEDDEIILLGRYHRRFSADNCIGCADKEGTAGKDNCFWWYESSYGIDCNTEKDALDTESLKASLISESRDAIKEMELKLDDDEEDDI